MMIACELVKLALPGRWKGRGERRDASERGCRGIRSGLTRELTGPTGGFALEGETESLCWLDVIGQCR